MPTFGGLSLVKGPTTRVGHKCSYKDKEKLYSISYNLSECLNCI